MFITGDMFRAWLPPVTKGYSMLNLTDEQQVLLTAYLALAIASPPNKHDPKEHWPHEYSKEITVLSVATKKFPRTPFRDYHVTEKYAPHLGAVGGTQRRVKAAKNNAALCS